MVRANSAMGADFRASRAGKMDSGVHHPGKLESAGMRRAIFALLAFTVAGYGQNPNAAVFPSRAATDDDLLVASNSARTTLSSPVTDTDTTIPVADTSHFLVPAAITIDAEIILCTSKTSTTFTSCTRGFDSSTAKAHYRYASVYGFNVAHQHNQAAAEIKAVETYLKSAPSPGLTSGTSILKGNGTGGFASAASTDVVSLFSTCSGTQYLGADGACHSSPGLTSGTTVLKGNGTGGFAGALSGDIVSLFSGCSGTQYLGADGTCYTALNTSGTSILKGNGTGGFATAASSDVISLFSGCSGTQYLGADGACHTSSSSAAGSDTQVMFNNRGAFAGDTGFVWNYTTHRLTANALTISGQAGGGTQCLNIDNAGNVSGTGSTCGGGSGTVTSVGSGCGLTGGPITSSGTLARSETINAQIGTTYTVVNGDCGKLLTFSNASGIAVTLPQAGSGGNFVSGWSIDVQNIGSGAVTISPTTSTIDGASSIKVLSGQGVRIVSNGTNYFTLRGMSPSAGVAVVSYSATPTFDLSLGSLQKITLTGNVTSSTASNPMAGAIYTWEICQDATGSRTFVFPGSFKGTMNIGSTASTCSVQSFVYDGSNYYATTPGVVNQ
jgi:hypothetical protein